MNRIARNGGGRVLRTFPFDKKLEFVHTSFRERKTLQAVHDAVPRLLESESRLYIPHPLPVRINENDILHHIRISFVFRSVPHRYDSEFRKSGRKSWCGSLFDYVEETQRIRGLVDRHRPAANEKHQPRHRYAAK